MNSGMDAAAQRGPHALGRWDGQGENRLMDDPCATDTDIQPTLS